MVRSIPRHAGVPVRPLFAVLALVTVFAAAPVAAQEPPVQSDEGFIQSLGDRYSTQPVDRQRLGRLFFGVASTLDGGKSTVEFLRSRLASRDLQREELGGAIREMYDAYASQVARFRVSAERLLDDTGSRQKLFRVMMDGHQSCWQLDRYTGMVETYGASPTDLMSVLSSTEACERFRRAAFEGRVLDLIAAALGTETEQAATIEDLREELAELQKLLDDLQAIDAN